MCVCVCVCGKPLCACKKNSLGVFVCFFCVCVGTTFVNMLEQFQVLMALLETQCECSVMSVTVVCVCVCLWETIVYACKKKSKGVCVCFLCMFVSVKRL